MNKKLYWTAAVCLFFFSFSVTSVLAVTSKAARKTIVYNSIKTAQQAVVVTKIAARKDSQDMLTAKANPIAHIKLWVDPDSAAQQQVLAWSSTDPNRANALTQIASQPVARWFGEWDGDIRKAVDSYVTIASNASAVPVVVAYNIPNRDCGSYSAGGAKTDNDYRQWIKDFQAGIAGRRVVIILEPDALATACVTDNRMALMGEAVRVFKKNSNATVYIDAGHPNWIDSSTMATRLRTADVATADGFALNVSNFYTTQENVVYGIALASLIKGKHFVIDTSRNGNGWNGEWCNPVGRKIGVAPLSDPGSPLVDALLWIKPPGESDGQCHDGPPAGSWWLDYAMGLVS